MAKSNPTVTLELAIHRDTLKAVLVSTDGDDKNAVWLPKSLVQLPAQYEWGEIVRIAMGERLAFEKGLI